MAHVPRCPVPPRRTGPPAGGRAGSVARGLTGGLARVLAAALVGLLAATGCGDGTSEQDGDGGGVPVTRVTSVTRSEPMSLPGQSVPAQTDTVTLWLGPGIARRDNASGTFLVDATRDLLAQVDHERQTWTVRTAAQVRDQLAALADTTGRAPSATSRDRRERLRSLLRVAVRVTDTGEEQEIDGHRCRRWIVEQQLGRQSITTEVWLTDQLDVDHALLHQVTRPALAALPGGEQALAELSRLRGVPVRSTSIIRALGRRGRTETELLEVSRETVPPAHFAPPPGYRRAGAARPDTAAGDRIPGQAVPPPRQEFPGVEDR
jgi:hypothetical protein